jgi:crossover junction endodeoxyribonuclease RuvC
MLNGKEKIILGLDPGIADTGYGVIKELNGNLTVLTYGSIKTAKGEPLPQRLSSLHQQLLELITKYQPQTAVVEQLFFCSNIKTAMTVGQARGVILLSLTNKGITIIEPTPLQVKQGITGYGKADKRQVQQMLKNILKLKAIPQPDDAADALAMAIYGSGNISNLI